MTNLSNTCKRIVLCSIAFALLFFGLGIIVMHFLPDFIDNGLGRYVLGIVFGTVFSILKIVLLEKTLNKAVDMPEENAINYTRLHYTLRYVLTGVVVVVAALNPNVSLFGVVLGLAVLRPAVYVAGKLENKSINQNN